MAVNEKLQATFTKVAAKAMNNEQVKELLVRFNALPERDRLALKVLGIFFGFLFVVFVIWFPAHAFVDHKQAAYEESRDLLTWMHANEALARRSALASNGQAKTGQALLSVVNMAAQTRTLNIKRLEPDGEKDVRVWLENAPYEQTLLWLFDLENQYQVHIKQITIDKQPTAGYVNAHILFGS